jgi:hypothetical protein
MRRPEQPRSIMGVLFGGTVIAAAVIGFFWIGTLTAVGLGWQPVADAAQRVAQAVGQ